MKLRVGLIGYGLSGSVFHAPVIAGVEGMHVQAVVSSDPDKVHRSLPEAVVVSRVEELVRREDVDLVVVTSPNTMHFDHARQAIQAGKHVVVEKPFTVTAAEADELIALSRERDVLLTVYHNRRWDGDFLTVKKLVESGVLGRVSTFVSHFDRYRPQVRNRWREQDLPGSGLLYDLGSHLIDQALILFGMPDTVWADLRKEREGAEAVDAFQLVLGYERMRVILQAGSLVRDPGPRFAVHGERGSFVKYGLDPQEDQLRGGMSPGMTEWGREPASRHGQLTTDVNGLKVCGTVETLPGCYEQFYQGVAEAIRSRSEPPVRPEEARDVIALIECAIRSHREGRVVAAQPRSV